MFEEVPSVGASFERWRNFQVLEEVPSVGTRLMVGARSSAVIKTFCTSGCLQLPPDKAEVM